MILDALKPTNDLLVIRRIVDEEPRTASGIYLPPVEDSAETPWRGVVLAAGPGKPAKLSTAASGVVDALADLVDQFHSIPNVVTEGPRGIAIQHWQGAIDALGAHAGASPRMPMQVKVGDTVIFSRNGYQEFKIDGETLVVMGEASIMGVLEQEVSHA